MLERLKERMKDASPERRAAARDLAFKRLEQMKRRAAAMERLRRMKAKAQAAYNLDEVKN